ncbi:MAG TPA: ROK family protein, partial [Micromonosporaceae bacterium]
MPAATRAIDEPVRQRSLRTHNLGLVLRQVAACPDPVSRAELSATTGLTKATVSTLVDELIGGGLLAEVGPAPRTGAGRPAVGLRLATAVAPAGLGLEINVDYLSCAVVDLTGAVRHRATHWADQRGRSPAQVGHDLGDLVAMACAQAGAQRLDLAGVALAVPGLVAEGVVRVAPNLGWREVELRSWLPDALRDLPSDLPVTVDNEANLATLAELATLGAGEPDSFLY